MAGSEEQVIASTTDVSAHGWAGAPIELILAARDDLGQEGRSAPLSFILPQRLFAKSACARFSGTAAQSRHRPGERQTRSNRP